MTSSVSVSGSVVSSSDGRSSPQHRLSHVLALDGLRGIAILLVILHNSPHYAPATGLIYVVALIAAVGWIGVQLFFVLSGFLITSNLFDAQGATNYFRVFFARRALRIFPLYFTALALGLIVFPWLIGNQFPAWHEQIWLWTFLFNWAHPLGAPALGFPHFWSLAVEEQFYLVWPFLLYRTAPQRLARLCVSLMVAALIIRVAMSIHLGADTEEVYEFTVCRMDALAAGALIAALLRYPGGLDLIKRNATRLVPAAIAVLLVGAVITRAYTRGSISNQTIGYTLLTIGFALIVLAAVVSSGALNLRLQRILSNRALRSIGKYSYGMYVIHFPITLAMERLLPRFKQTLGDFYSIPFVVLIGVFSYCAAVASYHLLEKRFLRLKSRFTPAYSEGAGMTQHA